jgi:hypothetical protein
LAGAQALRPGLQPRAKTTTTGGGSFGDSSEGEGTVSTQPTAITAATLADLPLETEYRSDTHDLVRDFYVPCLERSTRYRRAVGYFTSRGLSVAAQGTFPS